MTYHIDGRSIEHDAEGYLLDVGAWSRDLAIMMAEAEGLVLAEDHWVVVEYLREYYDSYGIAPAQRVVAKHLGDTLRPENGVEAYLHVLFPAGLVRQACKIAGLPKPVGCV